MTTYTQASPYSLKPGDLLFFRNAGVGPAVLCRIQPRGELGQVRIAFVDAAGADLPGIVAVNENRELWRRDP